MPLLLTIALLLLAQAPQPFRTGINVVEVDVVVSDRSGKPVRGLQREDFEVFEDGRPVEIATFVPVDLPAAPPDGQPVVTGDRSGTSVASNDQLHDGRVILIVFDDYHVSFAGARLVASKAIARRVVERLGPSDQAAIITTSGQRSAQAEFTTDKARLIEAIARFFPRSETGASGIAEAPVPGGPRGGFGFVGEIKARWAMEALSNAARVLALIPSRRKTVLLVSQGLPVTLEEIVSNSHAGGAFQALREFILTAQRSNIAVYPIDPCGLELDGGCSTASREHLRSIAAGTGGFAVTNTNAPETGVDRLIDESGTYYLIGYYSPATRDDGARHRIRVRTRVPGVEVRAREGYVSPRGAGKVAPAPDPLDALTSAPIQTRGLPLHIVAVPVPSDGSAGAGVVIGVELPAADALRAGRIAFSAVAVDASGRSRGRRFESTFEAQGAAATGWTRTATRLDVEPGLYQIRLAAAAADGRRGSVFTEVTVPKFDSELGVGGLSLGVAAALGRAGADRMLGVLPMLPIAPQNVLPDMPLAAQLPIRVRARSATASLAIVTRLVGPDGSSRLLDSLTASGREYTAGAGNIYQVPLPRPLTPGAYRLVVETTLGRARLARELAFRVGERP